ncbi:prepilin-type N-terminal cleavage/methylation domain-containing protein [Prochlorococcus sp. MIT 0801]|uniref:TolB family protein n=1 Tax=Prochlorococcus sp. MIT 0801 TaxID=1501269 RepID=UPI0004F698F0|nr:prepilin-type N-terminal cleavage/methylation domain-containing protein [Prochlorococcus sp. MIT 0801]AIQ97405.1 hypothetical protein EW15_1313 [Prochlorococcus sp. MIT 0801]
MEQILKLKLLRKLLRKQGEEGFSLIELVVVVSVLAVLSAIAIPTFTCFQRKAQATAALAAMKQIQTECEINKADTGKVGTFTLSNLNFYQIQSDGSNGCSGASGTGLISAIPTDTNILPTFILASNGNELTYSFKGETGTNFSECLGLLCISSNSSGGDIEDALVKLSSGNGSNSIISCDGNFYTERGDWSTGDEGHVFRVDIKSGEKVLIDSTKDGTPSTGDSAFIQDLSCNGRYALLSIDEYGSVDLDGISGPNSQAGNSEGPQPIYRKDLVTGEITRVDTLDNNEKIQTSWGIDMARMSSDGRYVVFESIDTRFAGLERQDGGRGLIYRKDMETGELIVVPTKADGSPGSGRTRGGSYATSQIGISDDGSKISFVYEGDDLIPGASGTNLYVQDINTSEISLVSSNNQGDQLYGFGGGGGSSISSDGSKVVFTSRGGNGNTQIMVKDLNSGELNAISGSSSGNEGDGWSQQPSFSRDGNYVVFQSSATNIDDNDTNGIADIYVYNTSTGQTKRILDDKANQFDSHLREPVITSDGKHITFRSDSSGISPDGENQGYEIYKAQNPFF